MSTKEYLITDGTKYVKQKVSGKYDYVQNSSIADTWNTIKLANAILQNALPKAIRKDFYVAYWNGQEYVKCTMTDTEKKEQAATNENDSCTYVETELEKTGFNISDFFNNTIKTVSELRVYAKNMSYLEQEYNKKILDVRHYKRDTNTKLNAIQLQRLEQFEILLERERYECKSNRMIAEIFLTDLNRLENIKYIEVVKNVKESEYKPEILTYEMLDGIVGKKRERKIS